MQVSFFGRKTFSPSTFWRLH